MNHKVVLLISLLLTNVVSAATRVDLKTQSANYIRPYFAMSSTANPSTSKLNKTKTDIDFNQTSHVHVQQLYTGVPVWGATAIIHIKKMNKQRSLSANLNNTTTMNGVVYEGLDNDLPAIPTDALSDAQKEKALHEVKLEFEKKIGATDLRYEKESIKTIIYIDDNQKAHYAFLVSLYYDDDKTGAQQPTAIIDAESLLTYHVWDSIKTEAPSPRVSEALAGGIGGNEKSGEYVYDGTNNQRPAFNVLKMEFEDGPMDSPTTYNLCFLGNDEVTIHDMSYGAYSFSFCDINEQHNNIYWLSNDNNGARWNDDEANGGYSPSLDAFYGANTVINFYREWYGVPALVQEDGETPMKLIMRVHFGHHFQNAFWDGTQMTFGDGGDDFYPLTSLDIAAHEISHGFTSQHANIDGYEPQMGALHEAFSDEAAVAMQYYATGKNTWDIGREIFKEDRALRYLDDPKKDGSSIDNIKDFNETTEVHAGAGVFNKAFYLIATTKGWDIHKAFNVMIKANMNYWTSSMTTLNEAACGVVDATRDYNYNIADVHAAFLGVGIDTAECDTTRTA